MKKILIGILAVLALLVVGYLFIYPYDYQVRFVAQTFPGTINQYVKIWHKSVGVPGTEIVQEDLNHLEQRVQVGDSVHLYKGSNEPADETTSR